MMKTYMYMCMYNIVYQYLESVPLERLQLRLQLLVVQFQPVDARHVLVNLLGQDVRVLSWMGKKIVFELRISLFL